MTAQKLSELYGISKGKAARLLQYSTDINRIEQAAINGTLKRSASGIGYKVQAAIVERIGAR